MPARTATRGPRNFAPREPGPEITPQPAGVPLPFQPHHEVSHDHQPNRSAPAGAVRHEAVAPCVHLPGETPEPRPLGRPAETRRGSRSNSGARANHLPMPFKESHHRLRQKTLRTACCFARFLYEQAFLAPLIQPFLCRYEAT